MKKLIIGFMALIVSTPVFADTLGQRNARATFDVLRSEPETQIEFISHVVDCHIGTRKCTGQLMAVSDIKSMVQFFMDNGDVVGLEIKNISTTRYGMNLEVNATLFNDKPGIPSNGSCRVSPNKLNGDNVVCEIHMADTTSVMEIFSQSDAKNVYQR